MAKALQVEHAWLPPALKLERETSGGRWDGLSTEGHGCGVHQRQHPISHRGRDAQSKVKLPGPAATEYCRPDDQPAGLDALNIGRALLLQT